MLASACKESTCGRYSTCTKTFTSRSFPFSMKKFAARRASSHSESSSCLPLIQMLSSLSRTACRLSLPRLSFFLFPFLVTNTCIQNTPFLLTMVNSFCTTAFEHSVRHHNATTGCAHKVEREDGEKIGNSSEKRVLFRG